MTDASPARDRVAVLGAGAIGQALAQVARARGADVLLLGRPHTDPTRPDVFAAAAEAAGEELSHVIVATGLLHRDGRGPERDLRQIDPDWLIENFRANAVVPALAARFWAPRLRRAGRAVFAVLTARVGSITDNRLGGWYAYRMSKAAANQLVRTLSVELARKRPEACVVALHPGTVDTPMSRPFQRNLKPGQLRSPEAAARDLWAVMDRLTAQDTGRFLAWDGREIPW
ncbi:MAG: SDR family oxidoreductase [Sphingomonadaceae bacterium]|uniref:SDR family NAD(P)-dependent oxidoreductase n=1 Tax=Thermaurantiacus sp. TaxID=2820283 RepID=UPI00298EECD8|nr:SDR family NAD(P)-dependent oxidoreductase [Thermaurantiacus sp.]MCS6986251.1 SDR family oxidoreductase [Sphingomonadaceae bacterium]MDW8415698.1 SDR family oxidoreductase [Thermaurantiacus sp.]